MMHDSSVISIDEARQWLRAARLHLLAGLALGLLIGVAMALLLPRAYTAEVVVLPLRASESEGLMSGIADQLGGLAAIAGIGGQAGDSRDEALAYLRSGILASSFIDEHHLMPVLFSEQWDAARSKWRVEGNDEVPTQGDAVHLLQDEVLGISEDRRAAIVTVSVTWSDRELAARWANAFVELANQRLRDRKITESERVIQYLNAEVAKSSVLELREALYRLIEIELKSVALAKSRQQFAFRVIDPAVAPDPDDPAKPNRPLIVVLCVLFGMLAAAFAFVMGWGRRRRLADVQLR